MYLCGTDMSCGIQQMSGLTNEPIDNLIAAGNQMYDEDAACAFLMWSDVWGRYKKGNRLYHYIRRTFPKSSIQRTSTAKNPHSHNIICVYTWKIPRGFKKWWKENRPDSGAYSHTDYSNDNWYYQNYAPPF